VPRWGAKRPRGFSFAAEIAGAASRPIAAQGRSYNGPRQAGTSVQGSSPIPRKITLVTVCTALSNAMSDSISPPLSNCTW